MFSLSSPPLALRNLISSCPNINAYARSSAAVKFPQKVERVVGKDDSALGFDGEIVGQLLVAFEEAVVDLLAGDVVEEKVRLVVSLCVCASNVCIVLGERVGWIVSLCVGSDVGKVLGEKVGWIVSLCVGSKVGRVLGEDVGWIVSSCVGMAVGIVLGEKVGWIVGSCVGNNVGIVLGKKVG